MQLSEIRYITGLIVQGGGKIAGYSLAEPTGEVKKPDLVLAKDIKQYLTDNKCQIINAIVDASGQVSFRSKADQESYVTMNASGYILGWPKKPLNKLHEGNKTGGKTGETLKPTHSYLVVDINEAENVVKVMNIGGMVKPMTLAKLVSAINEGLIVSNVEVVNHRVKLLSKGIDELTIGKTISTSTASSQSATLKVEQPVTQTTTATLKPPTFVPDKELQKPTIPPVITPSQPVAKPVQQPVVEPKQQPTTNQSVIPPVTQPKAKSEHEFNFRDLALKQYNFTNYATDYSNAIVKIRLDLDDLAPEQFELVTINGKNCLTYVTDGSGEHELPYFIRDYGPCLRIFLELFSRKENRESLIGTIVNLYYNNKPVHAFDYRMLYMEQGFLNFAYLIDWYNVDLFHLAKEDTLWPSEHNAKLSLLYLPNKILDVKKQTLTDIQYLYGRFYACNSEIWSRLLLYGDLKNQSRTEDLTIATHPKLKVAEMKDYGIIVEFDYPFDKDKSAHKIHIDLSKTSLRFIGKHAIQVQHGANYILHVPATCTRLHNDAICVAMPEVKPRRRLDRQTGDYYYVRRPNSKDCLSVSQADTLEVYGAQIERIDKVGAAFQARSYNPLRMFVQPKNWTNITNLTDTVIAIEDLPKHTQEIDVAPYIDTNKDELLVNDWHGIGTWSDIGKGKLHVKLTSRPETHLDHTNLFISGTVSKIKIELVNEKESYAYSWPVIDYLFVEEGVTDVEIVAYTLTYQGRHRGAKEPGYYYNYIRHLILPPSCTNFVLKLTCRQHERFVREVDIPDNSVLSRLDLQELFKGFAVNPDQIYKYANEKIMHDKNMLSDMIGTDLTHVQDVTFEVADIKANLAFCGIIL